MAIPQKKGLGKIPYRKGFRGDKPGGSVHVTRAVARALAGYPWTTDDHYRNQVQRAEAGLSYKKNNLTPQQLKKLAQIYARKHPNG